MKPEDLNWNDLRYFLEVARTGRYLTAAKRLGVTHTTVSRRIATLEEALQARLFDSDERGLHLTALGESILPLAQQFEDVATLTQEVATGSDRALVGNLRIGAPDGIGNLFIANQLTDYMHRNPDLNIRLVPVPQSLNLIKREVDIAISLEPSTRKDIDCRKLTDYKLFLYGSRAYIEKHQVDIQDIEAVKRHPFAGYIPDILYTDQLNFNHLIAPGLRESFQGATVMSQFEFIANGGGFGVLPHFMVQDDSRFVAILAEQILFERSYWLLTPIELRRRANVRSIEHELERLVTAQQSRFYPQFPQEPSA